MSPSAQTPTGSFELVEVTRRGEPFRKGSPLERFLENVIPQRGIDVGGFRLRKPERLVQYDDAPFTAWILYRGTKIRRSSTSLLFDARILAENSAGRQIENPLTSIRGAQSNELLISVPLFAFPRDEDQILLRFSPPATTESAREWVTLSIKNPLRVKPANWSPEPLPRTNLVEGETAILKKLSIDPVLCEFKLPGLGWAVPDCSIQDPEGNAFSASFTRNHNDPGVISRGFSYTLETNKPWRIKATFVRATNFATADVLALRLTANAQGPSITNRIGQVSDITFDGKFLEVIGRPGEASPQWIITAATNQDNGHPLQFFRGAPFHAITGEARRTHWPLEDQCANIVIHIADPKSFTTEWHVDPSTASHSQKKFADFQETYRPPLPPPLHQKESRKQQ